MVYSFAVIFVLAIFFFVALTYGLNRALSIIPVLVILFFIFGFFGWFLINFFWLIPLVMLVNYMKNKNAPKGKKRTYYYRYDNSGSAQDFEEFFRQAGFGGYQQGGYQQGGYSNSSFSYAQDLTKYYEILGVTKTSTKEEIKKAYRDLVKKHHPDRFTNASESEKKLHEDKLKEINEAYEKVMKD